MQEAGHTLLHAPQPEQSDFLLKYGIGASGASVICAELLRADCRKDSASDLCFSMIASVCEKSAASTAPVPQASNFRSVIFTDRSSVSIRELIAVPPFSMRSNATKGVWYKREKTVPWKESVMTARA